MRLRIPIRLLSLALMSLSLLYTVTPVSAAAALPFVNQTNGFSTRLVLVNHGTTDATITHYFDPIGVGATPPIVAAKTALRSQAGWPHDGTGVAELELPADVEAFTEITTPAGALIRLGALPEIVPGTLDDPIAEFLGFPAGYESYLFIASPGGAVARVVSCDGAASRWASTVTIPAGGAAVVVPLSDRETVEALTGDVYAFAYSWDPAGSVSCFVPTIAPR